MITVRFSEDDCIHVLFSMHLSGHELHILVHSQYRSFHRWFQFMHRFNTIEHQNNVFNMPMQPRVGVKLHLQYVLTMSSCAYDQYRLQWLRIHLHDFMLAQVAFIENIQVVVHWLVVCTFTQLQLAYIQQYCSSILHWIFIEPDFTPRYVIHLLSTW